MAKTKSRKVAEMNEEATTDKKILYGDCFIVTNSEEGKESLVQNQTVVSVVNGKTIINDDVVVLIDDIWEGDLLTSGTYKSNKKKNWFYWEFDKTSIDNDDIVIKEKFECPKLKEKYYDQLVNGDFSGDYADYWKGKIETARENYEKEAAILKKEVILEPCPDYTLVDGTNVTSEKKTIVRDNPFDELGNLLSELF